MPRSLVPFQKIPDSKRTIYFKRPKVEVETAKQAEVAVAPKSAPRVEEPKPNALKQIAETKVEEKKPEPVAEEQPVRKRRIVKRKSEE